jgi:7,8-dihydropterin-6-yl-methyl-4-(beta-D-ribofuranosyl)aminobenzene 5'-phosphate synthase
MCSGDPGEHPVPIAGGGTEADWAGEVVGLEPVDSVSITTVCDNIIDFWLLDEGPARRLLSRAGEPPVIEAAALEGGKTVDSPTAEPGFSAHLEITKAGQIHRFLFDAGVTPTGCRENLARLDLSPRELEAIICSHGHFDHTTGLSGLLEVLGPSHLPVVIHPEFWSRRRIAIPGRDPWEFPSTSRRALTDSGFEILESRQPSFLFEGSVLVTGEVDRTTSFEQGFPIHQAYRNGTWEPDPLILDDQAVIMHVAGKGLVVLTGCGHAGIVNICRYAQRLTGINQLYLVMGGFHLNGPLFEPIIGDTCEALAGLAPEVLVPSHCTGWKAIHAMAARLPDAFIQNSVGTTFELRGNEVVETAS